MPNPLLYEINTRCWLRDLSAQQGKPVHLGNVPEAQFAQWQRLGFTHLWLMGVWTTGPKSRAATLADPRATQKFRELLPDAKESDLAGSPYAIADYQVPPGLGGEEGLAAFRRKLQHHGLKLLLDFVPSHLGLDHSWVSEMPALFVQGGTPVPGVFQQETRDGLRWLAYGRDPNFPPWSDTVQLDYRRAETRTAMLELLASVARRCDGVRCDMAMLVLNDVFARTWETFPCASAPPAAEFWAEAIPAIKQEDPAFLFLAEAYWDLEARLQELGFDFTYDKKLYDFLYYRSYAQAQQHLLSASPGFLRASAHFLENHDEPRAAAIFPPVVHRPLALLLLGLPGLRLLHEGQLTGARLHLPVQLGRRPPEAPQPEVGTIYQTLLAVLPKTAVGRGQGEVLLPRPAWPDNATAENTFVIQWQLSPPEFDLVVVNLASHRSQCYVSPTVAGLAGHRWQMKDRLSSEAHVRHGDEMQSQGLYFDLPAHGAQLFHFQPAA